MANKVIFNKWKSKDSFDEHPEAKTSDAFNVVKDENIKNEKVDANKDLYVGGVKITDAYKSHMEGEDLEMPNAVGGIAAGTTLGDLKDKTVGQILDDLLFPTIEPVSWSDPGITFSYSNLDVQVGTSVSIPTESQVTTTNGSWKKGWGDGGYLSAKSAGHDTINFATFTFSPDITSDYKMPAQNVTLKVSVYMKAGETPKNSKGLPSENVPAYAGGTLSTSKTIYPYYRWFATTAIAGQLDAQSKVRSLGVATSGYVSCTLVAGAGKDMKIKVPGTMTGLQFYSNGQWLDASTTEWTSEVVDDETEGRKYTVYSRSNVESTGEATWRFKVNPTIA